jgi:hypothetical protein
MYGYKGSCRITIFVCFVLMNVGRWWVFLIMQLGVLQMAAMSASMICG